MLPGEAHNGRSANARPLYSYSFHGPEISVKKFIPQGLNGQEPKEARWELISV